MKCKIKKFRDNAIIPTKSTTLAACHDLYISDIQYNSESQVICRLGVGMTPPEGYKINLAPRSSFSKHKWVLANSPGQGDRDYKGEYMAIFNAIPIHINSEIKDGIDYYSTYNYIESELEYESFPYKVGDRVIQMWISKVIPIEWEEVGELPEIDSNRVGGFGSTGK